MCGAVTPRPSCISDANGLIVASQQSQGERKKKKTQHRRYKDTLTIIRFKANKVFSDGSASLHRAEHLTEMAKFTEMEITDCCFHPMFLLHGPMKSCK